MPRRLLLNILIVASLCTLPLPAEGALLRTLKLGDVGEDVRELQQFLNRESATEVATEGPGSPGNETSYFGALTHKAVKKLQQKYAADILAPTGILSPTGIVGFSTRLFLLRMETKTELLVNSPSTKKISPVIVSVSPSIITKSTEELVIRGTGFTPTGNMVVISTEPRGPYMNLSSADGTTLRFMFHFSAGDRLKSEAKRIGGKGNYAAVVEAISKNIKERASPSGNAQIPALITVENKQGTTAAYRLLIDITAMLLDTEPAS